MTTLTKIIAPYGITVADMDAFGIPIGALPEFGKPTIIDTGDLWYGKRFLFRMEYVGAGRYSMERLRCPSE